MAAMRCLDRTLSQRRWLRGKSANQRFLGGQPGRGQLAGEHGQQQYEPQRIDVRVVIQLLRPPLLRAHALGGAK